MATMDEESLTHIRCTDAACVYAKTVHYHPTSGENVGILVDEDGEEHEIDLDWEPDYEAMRDDRLAAREDWFRGER